MIARKQVGTWLLIGVGMILVQILLGGITRLTGSGLSITEWDLIMGAIPPLNQHDWQAAFEQYKQFPQYKIMNTDMTLGGFKNIFWWEFMHRFWARLFIPVFLIPLAYFLWKKWISKPLLIKLAFVFVLGGLQGLVGWIMVASGLVDQPWVNPLKLSIHLLLALILLCYLFWISLDVLNPDKENKQVRKFKYFSVTILCLLTLQIFYGGLMAGNHAALFYPTFPKIGSQWIPDGLFTLSPFITNFFQSIPLIQVIHRFLGFTVAILIFIFYWKGRSAGNTKLFRRSVAAMCLLVILQICLGIITVLNSVGKIPITYAVAHQLVAVFLMMTTILVIFQIYSSKAST